MYLGCCCAFVEHVLVPEVESSSKIPEVVKSHEKLNLYLQKNNLSHCSILDTKHLELETTLERCLFTFTGLDTLDENNKFICRSCSYSDGKYTCVYYYKLLLLSMLLIKIVLTSVYLHNM